MSLNRKTKNGFTFGRLCGDCPCLSRQSAACCSQFIQNGFIIRNEGSKFFTFISQSDDRRIEKRCNSQLYDLTNIPRLQKMKNFFRFTRVVEQTFLYSHSNWSLCMNSSNF